jgi:hypothetical protein
MEASIASFHSVDNTKKKIWLEVSVRCYIKAHSISMLQYEKKNDFYLIITILEPHLIPNEITTSKNTDP